MEAYQRLEQELATWSGWANVVACSSGTAALHLAFESLCLPPGSEVIVPAFAMIACARAVTLAGLVPHFVDCNPFDLNLNTGLMAEAVTEKTRAVLVVHNYGRRCNTVLVHALAAKYDLYVVEDMAEIHGVSPHPATDAACWSFYKNKVVAGEEGGAIAFHHAEVAEVARELRCLGFDKHHDFWHRPRGHNYRMANALALLVSDSLRQFHTNLQHRQRSEAAYIAHTPVAWRMPSRDVPWVYDVRVPGMTEVQQRAVVRRLNEQGVAARHAFKPLFKQPEYQRYGRVTGGSCADRAGREVIYFPIQPLAGGEREALERAVAVVNEVTARTSDPVP